jgi:succinoglycan biosynthesis transport protein ExoP
MSELTADRIAFQPRPSVKLADSEGLSPRQLVALFLRNWRMILCFGLVVAASSYLASKTLLTQKFTADALVEVEMGGFAIPELQGVIGSETSDALTFVRSESQVLTSRALVQAVIEELNLTADPEFNSALNGPPLKARIGGAIRDRLPAAFAARLVAGGILPPAHARPPSPDVVMANVVGAVTNEIGIIIDGKTLLMGVNFSSEQADIASAVVNSLITRYMAGKVDERAVADRKANADLERRAEQVHAEIEQLEQQIRDTREKYNLVQTRDGSIGQQQLGDLSAALTQASSTRAQLEANYQRAGILVRTGGAGVDNTDALGSSIIGSLRNQEVTAERRVAQLQTTLGPGHPSRVSAEAELASARAAVITEAKRAMAGLGAQAAAARQHEAELRDQLAKAQTAAVGLSSVQSRLEQLEKDANARRELYRSLIQSASQTEANNGGPEQSGTRVVTRAMTPLFPSSPAPKLAAELGLITGFAFGGLFATVGRGRQQRNYSNAVDVTADTGLAVMAVLPRTKGRQNSLAARVVNEPAGPEAEALRSLRGRLRLTGQGSVPRSVLFVGSATGDGSSGIAAGFARVAALDGLRVLLIEGDLQAPKLAGTLGVAPSRGLIETLNGHDHWPENVARDSLTTMDLLLVGRPQPAASQLLETMQLQSLMAETREEYNLVVVDGHPVTQELHSVTLANIVDAVVLVVAAGETGREQVRAAVTAVSSGARRPPVVALSQAA